MNRLNTYFKKSFLISILVLSYSADAQFWSENFNNGCTNACPGMGYTSVNGTWTQTVLGPEGADPNAWYVSCAEQNNGIGNCSSGCTGGGNASLHVSASIGNPICPNDCGAAYDAGGLCGILSCPQTNRRIESPIINCSGQTTIFMNYSFIHGGTPGTDFASIWYYNGSAWLNIGTVPQSAVTASCSGQGTWSAANIVLPASANNNPNVKIGFCWKNNDDGVGTDPSVAIDNITLSALTSTPVPVISFTLPSPVCRSNTITATFTSTTSLTTFTWSASSPNVVFSAANSGTTNISFTNAGTYTISLTGCQGSSCGTGTSTIQVLPTPTVNVTASPTVVCTPGGSSTLTATGGPSASSYTWTASSGPAIPNVSVTVVSPTATTNYTVLTSIPGCTTGVTFNVPVAPAPTITVTPNSSICSSQSITLIASGGSTYTWSPSGSLSSANGSPVTASPTITTTYTVTGNNGVCSNTAAVTVSVTSSASATITSSNSTICSGQSTTLTASGGSTYTWTASSGANPPNNAAVTVTPATTTSYTVLTGSGTCTASAVASVSVAPGVTVTATPNATTICSGGSGVAITASGATSYTWLPTSGLTPSSGANVTANPAASTNYTVTGSNGVCSATAAVNVTVTVVSTSVTASAANYCIGGAPVTLTASGATSYAWSPATGLSSTSGAVVTATPAVTTVYNVTGTSGACSSVKSVTVTVPPVSTITVVSTGTVICAGGAGTTLTASGANTYTWLPVGANTNSINANPATNTTYTVGGQTALGCLAVPAVVTVSVAPAITPVITASSPSVCLSQTVALSVTPTGTGITYAWAPATAILGSNSLASVVAKPTNSNNVTYSVTVSNGLCSATATVDLQVFVCTPPTADMETLTNDSICTKGCVTFTANVTGSQPMTYQWVFPGGTPPTSNLSNPQVCYFAKGSYSVGLIVVNDYGSDTIVKVNYISVADTPAVVNAIGDTTIKVGQTTIISASGAMNYLWSPNINNSIACPTCSSTVVQPTVTTKYVVQTSNSPYCKRTDFVTVKVDFTCGDFFVPNAFSPNNDGLNDMINVHGFCIGTFVLQIYSRWGEKVFETSSLTESWDGTYQGKKMDTGVFVYRADGITIDGRPFNIKGNITLIR
ncbi:MAG: gliding motility-associated C-terminal domain-containing protein [Bacteroidota bacterium]